MSERRSSGIRIRWLNLWVVLGALAIGLGLFCLVLGGLALTRQDPSTAAPSTAALIIISAPTATPTIESSTPVLDPTNGLDLPPSPPPGEIMIGAFVQISGTGGDGLRLRVAPGLDGQVRLLGSEAEVFRVDDGPQEFDGYTWWYLVGPFDETRQGWAVANFLVVVQGP